MTRERLLRDERAIRDLIGFVLTFSIIITSVGVITTVGYDQLQEFRDAEQIDNAEQAMLLTDNNFEEIEQGGAMARSGELDLNGGTLAIEDGTTTFDVAVTQTIAPTNPVVSTTVETNSLRYSRDGTNVTLESGGVFRTTDGGNSVVLQNPDMACRDDRALVSLVEIRSATNPGRTSEIAGDGQVSVTGRRESSTLVYPQERSGLRSQAGELDVRIGVDSPSRSDAWEDYFIDNGDWQSPSPNTYVCEDVDAVFVRRTVINVTLSG